MERDPEKIHSLESQGTVLNMLLFFAHSAFFIWFFASFSSSLIIFILFLFSLIVCHTQTHTHTFSLCDEFSTIFHSGRRLSFLWSWVPEFPLNEFFYYASPLHPLQTYSLTAMWPCVNTKLPRMSISLCMGVWEKGYGVCYMLACYSKTNTFYRFFCSLWLCTTFSVPITMSSIKPTKQKVWNAFWGQNIGTNHTHWSFLFFISFL